MGSPRRSQTAESLMSTDTSYSGPTIMRRNTREFGSRTSVLHLPSLPSLPTETSSTLNDKPPQQTSIATPETSYVEFDLSGLNSHNNNNHFYNSNHSISNDILSEKVIGADPNKHSMHNDEDETVNKPIDAPNDNNDEANDEEDDFFDGKESNWKSMKKISSYDYYNERGELEFTSDERFTSFDNLAHARGYTKIDTEEQLAKYAELNKKTDFLFEIRKDKQPKPKKVDNYSSIDNDVTSGDESDYEDDDNLDSDETLEGTKEMLTDAQKFAYVGIAKLISVDMATDLAKLQKRAPKKLAKNLSNCQKNFANWTMYVITKLYEHMDLTKEEKQMIENLSIHGLEVTDLCNSLVDESSSKPKAVNLSSGFDMRWVIICDLFLLLIGDGYYDCRSRTLLTHFAHYLHISELDILQFERRLIESLELDTSNKTIENKDELLNDRLFIDKHIKRNKNRRLAYIGLATIGGSLAIGLSAGLLAPVIGAGLAAGLTTVGIGGTSGFLAGVGGSAIITTGGVLTGAKVGSKAGARRVGDVETFEFKPLHNNKRTNLILTVSGWMNGKLDDVRLPFSTIDPVMGDMFSLLWEPEMLQSMGQTIGILASEALTTSIQQILGATILSALMSAIQLPMVLSKLSYLLDNPWNVSLDRAWKAGKILADTLISGNMGVRPITLVGFSLGSRVIYSCLIEMAKRGAYGLIENVIILGNPVTVKYDQITLARSVVSGRFINGFSRKDWILGYLFRATGGGMMTVAGLSEIKDVEGVENIDLTDLVEGHMSYRRAIPKILKRLNWEMLSEEFSEIEEADPEQGEKTRQLISEFDEAKAKMIQEQNENKNKQKGTWKSWFKPKQKEWWDIYDQGNSNSAKLQNEENESNRTRRNTTGATAEYHESPNREEPAADPMFDVNALLQEVQDIEKIGNSNEESLQKVRQDLHEPEKKHKSNEEVEEEELEKHSSILGSATSKLLFFNKKNESQ